MDKQRVKSVFVATESPYLIPAVISKLSFYRYLISRQRLVIASPGMPGCRHEVIDKSTRSSGFDSAIFGLDQSLHSCPLLFTPPQVHKEPTMPWFAWVAEPE